VTTITVADALSLALIRGETKSWDLELTNDDGTALAGTFSNARCEWRRADAGQPLTDTSTCVAAFGTDTPALATGSISIVFADPAWVITLAIDNTQSRLLEKGSFGLDIWADLDGEPVRIVAGKVKVGQNVTVLE